MTTFQSKEQMPVVIGTVSNWSDLPCVLYYSCEKPNFVRPLFLNVVAQDKGLRLVTALLWINSLASWVKLCVANEEQPPQIAFRIKSIINWTAAHRCRIASFLLKVLTEAIRPLKARYEHSIETCDARILDSSPSEWLPNLFLCVYCQHTSLRSVKDINLERLLCVRPHDKIISVTLKELWPVERQLNCAATGHFEVFDFIIISLIWLLESTTLGLLILLRVGHSTILRSAQVATRSLYFLKNRLNDKDD